jgi:hypothetical protein
VIVYDIGLDADSGRLFITLEYLHGRPLDVVLSEGGPLPWRQAVDVARRVAEAIHHAHSRGIVHRDVKPSNVFLLEFGEAKIVDFGIAKAPASEMTQAGQVLGSPAYMSPERVYERPVDGRTDLFSLGAVLYEMLTGRRAFGGRNVHEILRRVAAEEPEPASRLVPGLPVALDAVLARAMAKRPEARQASAEQLARELEAILGASQAQAGTTTDTLPVPLPAPAVGAAPEAAGGTVVSGQALTLPAGKRVALELLSGPEQGRVITLDRPRVAIGRAGAGAAQIEVLDPEMSKVHASLECYGDKILLVDAGSTNGTFFGDERVRLLELRHGMELRMGRTRFRLLVTEAS